MRATAHQKVYPVAQQRVFQQSRSYKSLSRPSFCLPVQKCNNRFLLPTLLSQSVRVNDRRGRHFLPPSDDRNFGSFREEVWEGGRRGSKSQCKYLEGGRGRGRRRRRGGGYCHSLLLTQHAVKAHLGEKEGEREQVQVNRFLLPLLTMVANRRELTAHVLTLLMIHTETMEKRGEKETARSDFVVR